MTGDQNTANPSASGGHGGLIEHARELCASLLAYIQARFSLAGIEAKEAAIHFGIIIGLCVAALGVLVFGYLFLCIALTLLIAQWLGIAPGWVILGLACLHFIVALSAVAIAALRLRSPVFTETMAELKKDQQWLNRK